MLRRRRLCRPATLLSITTICVVVGYILLQRNWTPLYTFLSESKELTLAFKFRDDHSASHPLATDISEFEKLNKIAALLDIDTHVNGSFKGVQSKILQIETIIDRYRTAGDDADAGGTLQKIRELLVTQKPSSAEGDNGEGATADDNIVTTEETITSTTSPDKELYSQDMSQHVEDLLEKPSLSLQYIPKITLYGKPFMRDALYLPSNCPRTITKLAEESLWFKTRYIPDIKIFMDKEDVNNFANFYKLSHYGLPFGIKSVDRGLLARVLNNPNFTNPNIKANRPECVRCAVVGSGGVLKGSNMGSEIDAHDYVFRVNVAPTTATFERDTGTRTSFYTFFPESQFIRAIKDHPELHYIFGQFKPFDVRYASHMIHGIEPPSLFRKENDRWYPQKPVLDVSRLKIVHPDFMRYAFTRFLDAKAYRPTTGALTSFIALHLCDEVSMYGFGYDPRFPIHYYDTKHTVLTEKAVIAHDVANERNLWHRLSDEHIINFYNRTYI